MVVVACASPTVGCPPDPMRFALHGAERLDAATLPVMEEIEHAIAGLPGDCPGSRLHGLVARAELFGLKSLIGSLVARFTGGAPRPVRALLFDKNTATNWSLAWHQDRTICVRGRMEVAGFGPWTVKSGLLHVAPPIALLEQMVTIRVHLDDVPVDNAPLLIAPGSHRFGLVREDTIDAVVKECGVHTCIARAGDIWIYATPILHASHAAAVPGRRRVLQLDYATFNLPGGLEWSGI